MNEQNKYRTLAFVLLAGLVTFLYQMAGVVSKLQNWQALREPVNAADMMVAVAAALVAMGAALGLDLPAMIRGFRKQP